MDYAIVGVAVQAGEQPGIALVNMGSVPRRADAASQALASGAGVDAVAALAADGTNPPEDLNANADYRRHLASVLTKRALLAAGYR
jgi:carbon-monoxide dehydrogenase medium subunit